MKTPFPISIVLLACISMFIVLAGPLHAQPRGVKSDSRGKYNDERWIYGETVDTPELHNQHYQNGMDCYKVGDGKWCFKQTLLSVRTPDPSWAFVGQPQVDCARDNQGSAEWNILGSSDRFFVKLNNPNEVRASILTGSHSIGVRLRVLARHYR